MPGLVRSAEVDPTLRRRTGCQRPARTSQARRRSHHQDDFEGARGGAEPPAVIRKSHLSARSRQQRSITIAEVRSGARPSSSRSAFRRWGMPESFSRSWLAPRDEGGLRPHRAAAACLKFTMPSATAQRSASCGGQASLRRRPRRSRRRPRGPGDVVGSAARCRCAAGGSSGAACRRSDAEDRPGWKARAQEPTVHADTSPPGTSVRCVCADPPAALECHPAAP